MSGTFRPIKEEENVSLKHRIDLIAFIMFLLQLHV